LLTLLLALSLRLIRSVLRVFREVGSGCIQSVVVVCTY
jgi:hypothetical protein